MVTPLLFALVLFLGVALFLYALFGGADFGAGILELFLGKDRRQEQREVIAHAIAPVWETNHVWLILAVVIVFMGFPKAFSIVSIHLHLPLMAVLLGIVVRGCAFTFRHYDVDRRYDRWYTALFTSSSVWTPFFLGVTVGAATGGSIDLDATSFRSAYIQPWFGAYPAAVGVFTQSLFAMLAAVFLVGETSDLDLRRRFRTKALWATVATVVTGALVFATADDSTWGLRRQFLSSPLSLACFATATLFWGPFWVVLRRVQRPVAARAVGGAMVALVFIGWFAAQYPTFLRAFSGGLARAYSFENFAAPESTQRALLGALVVGSLLIFPALGYLLWVFKRVPRPENDDA